MIAQFFSELILLAITILFSFSSSTFIYQNIPGTIINNSGFNFSIYSTNLIGIILYGGDSIGNKLLIEIDQINNEKIIHLKMNKLEINEKIKTICECSQCSNVVMIFVMKLNVAQINISCNGKSNILQMIQSYNQDAFHDYPKLNTNKTFIIMGNIGFHVYYKDIAFKPLNNQLIGCLNKFYYNNKLINFSSNGTKFNRSCNEEYKEIICKDGNCIKKNVSYKFEDCSISSMNSKYCRNNLKQFIPNNNCYYNKLQENLSEIFRLNWKILYPNQFCLLEIKLKNETYILFHINMIGQILFNIKYRQLIIDKKILTNISFTGINILLINFNYTNFIIKISNGENIYTFNDKFIDYPISINVGMSKYFNICQPFYGLLDVKYDSKYWRSSSCHSTEHKITGTIIGIIVLVSSNIFILCLIVMYLVQKRFRNLHIKKPHFENHFHESNEIKSISMPIHIEQDYHGGDEYCCIQDF